jgi:hypothetical protein
MELPIVLPGDEFATRNPMALGAVINFVQRAKAADDESAYTHTGIVLAHDGTTLEALWKVKRQNLWEAYRGERVLIVRNLAMTQALFSAGVDAVIPHFGQWYPAHRLMLHLAGIAKWIHWKRLVCSELTAKFEAGCAAALGEDRAAGFLRNYYGITPDDLTDRWRMSRHYLTVFEGVLAY